MIDGLKAEHRAALIDALAADDRVERAVLFGSRATETYTSASDVDIALFGDRLTLIDLARLNGAIDALTIPQRVDLLLHAMIDNDVLCKHIERQGVEWYQRRGSQGTDLQRLLRKHRLVLEAILREHLPDTEVWAYGNRASSPGNDGRDLNLVLRARNLQKIPDARLDDFRKAVCNASFPLPVKSRDWARLPEQFRQEIERECVVLVEKTEPTARADWKTTTLGDCIQMNDSFYSPKEAWPIVNYLDTGNITENRVDKIHCLVSEKDKIPSRARRKVRPGDILYSTVRPNQKHFGLLKEVPEYFLASTGFSVFRGKAGIASTDFIYWFLAQNHIVERLHAIAEHTTSAYPSIRPYDIEALTLSLPPYPEQRTIAHVLGTLDDKIELNRRMNETLEATAQAIFKDWFVDFGPVRAKLAGRNTGLPDDIAELFPKKLVDSEFGKIPERWSVYRLDDLAEHHTSSLTPSTYPDTVFEHFSIPAYDGNAWPTMDRGEDIKSNKTVVPPDAVLLSKLNPEIRRVWIPGRSGGQQQICSTEFLAFTAKEPASRPLLFCMFTNAAFRGILQSMVTGTSRSHQRVQTASLKRHAVLAGTPELFGRFCELAGPILERVSGNCVAARFLALIRDTLLPSLVSGALPADSTGNIR